MTKEFETQEPVAYLHDDGHWTAAKTAAGRQLNEQLSFAGSPKLGVYTNPQPSQPNAELVAWPVPMEHPPLYADEDPAEQVRAARYRTGWNECLAACKAATRPQLKRELTDEKKYRLLTEGERIESGDTALDDDCVTWNPLSGWEVGMQWGCRFMKPIRRAIDPEHGIKGEA